MIKRTTLLFTLFFLASSYCVAQTVLLSYDKATEPKYDKGPNQRKFVQGFLKFGMITPPDKEETQVKYGSSVNLGFGLRSKYKVGAIYSLGWELELDYTTYKFEKDPAILSPTGSIIDIRRFDATALKLGFFNRFNFDPNRGNFMGNYLDLGINAGYAYSMKEVSKYSTGYGSAVTKVGNLDYVNSFQSEVFAKIGHSRIGIWAKYRLTDLFESKSEKPELPRMSVGIELGLY